MDGDRCVPIAHRGDLGLLDGDPIEPPTVPVGQGVTGHVAESGKALLIPNALEVRVLRQIPGTQTIDESVVCVPLRYGSRVVGVVFLSKLGIDQFDDDDMRLLEVLAGHASVVLENARLYEAMRREAENAKAWLEFSDSLTRAGSFDAISAEAVKGVSRLLEIEQCSLWLEDRDTAEFFCAASEGYTGSSEAITRQRIAAAGRGERFLDERRTPFIVSVEELRDYFFGEADLELCAIAAAPLPSGYGVRGWISVREADGGVEKFTDARLRLLDGMAYRLSMALQKSALFRDQQESAEIANALLEVTRELAAAPSEQAALERIVELAARMIGGPRAYVMLQEPPAGDVHVTASFGTAGREVGFSFPGHLVEPLMKGGESFVLSAKAIAEAARPYRPTVPVAVAPLKLPGSRFGCLVVAAPAVRYRFTEPKLRLLAGMAHQTMFVLGRAR